jgi:proteasome beta subunit
MDTGTTVAALTTADAAVLASLGGRFVANKDVRKVAGVHPRAATACSGAVGHIQQFNDTIRAEASLYETRRGEPPSMTALSTVAANVLRSAPMRVQPVLGGVDEAGPRLFDIDVGGGILTDRYTAAGSGMQLAYGVLEREYEPGLDVEGATAVAARAVDAASSRDTASGDGLTVSVVTGDGVRFDEYDDLAAVAGGGPR